jgi:hypothetical protein
MAHIKLLGSQSDSFQFDDSDSSPLGQGAVGDQPAPNQAAAEGSLMGDSGKGAAAIVASEAPHPTDPTGPANTPPVDNPAFHYIENGSSLPHYELLV